MKILAIETSSDACSIGLQNDDQIFLKHQVVKQQHAHLILNWITELLAEAQLTLSEIDAISYSCGPGSFTGIRIGAAVGQGLALSKEKTLLAVPSLQVLAQGVHREFNKEKIIVLVDARMGQLYCGDYELSVDKIMKPNEEDKLIAIADIELPSDDDLLIVANISENSEVQAKLTSGHQYITNYYPNARDVLTIASDMLKRGETTSIEEALPIYLRENAWKKLKN